MKNKLVYALILVIILFIGVGIFALVSRSNETKLKKEVNTLSSLDFYKDNFNREYVTSFGYRDVEKAIKIYLDEYSTELKNMKSITEDKELKVILTIDNYKSDGPKFTKSHEYIKNSKTKYNDSVDKIIKMSDRNTFIFNIDKYTKNNKYISLYKELIEKEKLIEKIDNKELLENNKTNINKTLDNTDKILTFLTKNEKNWEIDDGKLKFTSEKLLKDYNKLINNL